MSHADTQKNPIIKPKVGRHKPRPGIEEQSKSILDAAVYLFLASGVRSISVMQICDKADVSRSTFYRCFDSIDSLLQHIYSVSVFEPVDEFMLNNLNDPITSSEKLRQALDTMFEDIFAQGEYADLLFRESNDPNSPAFNIVNETFDKITTTLSKALPITQNKSDKIFIKALLNANQWIVHNAIRNGLTPANKKAAKAAAWEIVKKVVQ